MPMLDAAPAVRQISTNRSDLLALDVFGRFRGPDAENLFGLLEAAYALHPTIDVLVRMIDHEGVDWGEIDRNTWSEGEARAKEHIRRCACVGEPDFTASLNGWFSNAGPVELRHFPVEEEAAAWEWLAAEPVDQA